MLTPPVQALTAMVRQIRAGRFRTGLVLANGGVATYQHVVCLSRRPRADGSAYPARNPLPELIDDLPVPVIAEQAEGEATVEVSHSPPSALAFLLHGFCRVGMLIRAAYAQTYTVDFGRDGRPALGHVVGRLKRSGHRFLANHGDEQTLKQLASWSREPIGRWGVVKRSEDGRNLFFFEQSSSL